MGAGRLGRVSLHLFDTATRELREFTPLTPGRVGIYICGLTTQGAPHIGHVRFAVAFDVLRRWLERGHGYRVDLIRNVTDIDDKILTRAAETDEDWYALSYRNEVDTAEALRLLNVLPPTYEPRATGHIPEMVELMEAIIERGHGYAAEDGSGDVYFDVRSWPTYGSLTRQKLEDMADAGDADPRGKRDPRDFALWKGHKPEEPTTASWPTPFGRGRPGWHLECSAMARKYLGATFDIHGGGVDLRFPHHENEQAQSQAAGLGFARFWLHNAWVTVKGSKMGKSLGNALEVTRLTETVRPIVLRYYLTAAHYRSMIEYHDGALDEAQAVIDRIEGFLARALPDTTTLTPTGEETLPTAFVTAMNDDIGVPGALAVIHDTVRAGNAALDRGDVDAARESAYQVVAMTDILGVNPSARVWESTAADAKAESALDALIAVKAAKRAEAKREKDFAAADAIRDELTAAGIIIEDTADGYRYHLGEG